MATLSVRKDIHWERQQMSAYRAAMRKALAMVSLGGGTMLDLADQIAGQVPPLALISWRDVSQFIRLHPDVDMWAPALITTVNPSADVDRVVDAIFRLAMAIDARTPTDALLADLIALL